MTSTLNCLSGKLLISSSLRLFSFILFFPLEHIPLFLHFAGLCVSFCALNLTATSLSLGVALGHEPYHSTLPLLLVLSQTCVIVQAAYFIFNSSQSLRVCKNMSLSQNGSSQSAPRFRLIGNQTP